MAHKRITGVFIILFLSFINAFAQTAVIAKGDAAIKNHDFAKAQSIFKTALGADTGNLVLKEKLAGLDLTMGNYEEAEALYSQITRSAEAASADEFYYAQALRSNGKYELAAKAYARFAAKMPNDSRAKEFKNFEEAIRPLVTDKGAFKITDVPENSDAGDIGPTFCVYGLCFPSSRSLGGTVKHRDVLSGKAFYNLYILPGISRAEAALLEKKRKAIKDIRLDEGPASFSYDGSEVIFTRSNPKKGADGAVKLGLYQASFDSVRHKWVDIHPININNHNYNMAHPALSKDGKQLFFVSDMPGGFGETDIYVSNKAGNKWSEPVNLGGKVNTPGKELFPFMGDNGTLFFSSDSHIGLGGFDIYSATQKNGQWEEVHNMGQPFNSRYDDFGFICNEQQTEGYFVSNRPGGQGICDIYKFEKEK